MRSSLRPMLFAGCLLLLFSTGTICAAQNDTAEITRLQWRYDGLLNGSISVASAEKGITEERARLHAELEEELTTQLEANDANKTLDPTSEIVRQRAIVTSLQESLNKSRVDLELLTREELIYKKQENGSGVLMITQSYPELLSRKALLEERVDVLKSFHTAQTDRLNRLKADERLSNFSVLFTVLIYIGVFLATFWCESFIRTKVLTHIRHRKLRYAVTKTFTITTYLALFFWFVQEIISEHPGVLTTLAVVGAALIFVSQDVLKGIVGWIAHRNTFTLGDRIAIGDNIGDVVDIGPLNTSIMIARSPTLGDVSRAGKVVRIPNEQLLSQPLLNYHSTSDFENVELKIRIEDPNQSEEAHRILAEIMLTEAEPSAKEAQRQTDIRMRGYYFSQENPTWRIYMELNEKGAVEFTICFPALIGNRRAATSKVTQRLLQEFLKSGIRLKVTE